MNKIYAMLGFRPKAAMLDMTEKQEAAPTKKPKAKRIKRNAKPKA